MSLFQHDKSELCSARHSLAIPKLIQEYMFYLSCTCTTKWDVSPIGRSALNAFYQVAQMVYLSVGQHPNKVHSET